MKDKLTMKLAWALPKRLVMWCAVRLIAHGTTGKYSRQVVPDLTAMEALKRWELTCGDKLRHDGCCATRRAGAVTATGTVTLGEET